ncbi:PREDICTED: uncharacterized protein LOC104754871 [Camelina sativa]|uniref:Uncharacterized protein LOC104754871 n=1 Tax=Camelina sativa TaxID=90675 RepID=A0ABM0WSB4_CAMSA|nr:PREDICTED: uncharacterized protein LOC104754871 [Camelina sativa]
MHQVDLPVSDLSQNPRSGTTVPANFTGSENYTVLPPKSTSPIFTNKASTSNPLRTNPPPSQTSYPIDHQPPPPPSLTPNPSLTTTVSRGASTSSRTTTTTPLGEKDKPTLAERLKQSTSRSLKRLAPVSIADSGRPRIHIPDAVFERGDALHKDFIICSFNGRPPSYHQIQSVLNHIWGKGKRLEIHMNHMTRSMLVRIPNDYIRQKVLEKGIWYIGDSMFHTSPWAPNYSSETPTLASIPIWIHLLDIPLDLRTTEGISLIAGLVGEPKETDHFTLNLVSLKISHAKVIVDLTKPLPDVVEYTRDNGQVVEVKVTYPWLPPTCSYCKELGHIAKNCLQLPPPQDSQKVTIPGSTNKVEKTSVSAKKKGKGKMTTSLTVSKMSSLVINEGGLSATVSKKQPSDNSPSINSHI